MINNILTQTDGYKISQWKVYDEKMTKMFSYLESRGGESEETVFFGLQYLIKKYLVGVQVTEEKINEMETFCLSYFGRSDVFNRDGWEYILKEHGGKLPVCIRAAPEGTVVPTKNVLLTIENTDPNCAWLVNYLETLILKIWYSISVSTRSHQIKKSVLKHLEKSGTPELAGFKVVDFAYRGCSSEEQAGIGGLAHLISFSATDTIAAIIFGQKYYNSGVCAGSIPATEHSCMVSKGRLGEVEQCRRFLEQYPSGLVACVSDTYDIFHCAEHIWGGELKEMVESRDGTLTIRPDSGDFFEIVPKLLEILSNKFGFYINSKGYKVLNDKVRLIQGDGMNPETIHLLFDKIIELGWSADNLTVGSGGGLLIENLTRDTHKFAIKASWAEINGVGVNLFKQPITDGGKASKAGRLKLIKSQTNPLNIADGWKYKTVTEADPLFWDYKDELETVFLNGKIVKEYNFEEIRKRAAGEL